MWTHNEDARAANTRRATMRRWDVVLPCEVELRFMTPCCGVCRAAGTHRARAARGARPLTTEFRVQENEGEHPMKSNLLLTIGAIYVALMGLVMLFAPQALVHSGSAATAMG